MCDVKASWLSVKSRWYHASSAWRHESSINTQSLFKIEFLLDIKKSLGHRLRAARRAVCSLRAAVSSLTLFTQVASDAGLHALSAPSHRRNRWSSHRRRRSWQDAPQQLSLILTRCHRWHHWAAAVVTDTMRLVIGRIKGIAIVHQSTDTSIM